MCRLLLLLTMLIASPSLAEEASWAFPTLRDPFASEALLDLSQLNEAVAGETGFIRLSPDGNSFVRGDGQPIRFWAVNTEIWQVEGAALREHARFLAKRGVNMVRFHGHIPQSGRDNAPIDAINEAQRDQLWRLISAMKSHGIYVTLSPYFPHAVSRETTARWPVPLDSPGMTGLIYFDPRVQEAYKAWLRQLLLPENPYTGLALKDDPALAILQMQNEDSLLFWTLNTLKGREMRMLAQRLGMFLGEKYGSLAKARQAWRNAAAPGPIDGLADDWDQGIIALAGLWHLTRAANTGRAEARIRDQAQFLSQLMRDWHREIARFLREEIGARQLFNAGNWKTADAIALDDLERWSYLPGEVVGVNHYVSRLHQGAYDGWAIVAGDRFRGEGILGDPLALPIAQRQPVGRAYILPETLWVPPIWEQSEAPLLMAAYQALGGVDISYWFRMRETQWRAPGSANGYLPSIGKWQAGTPMIFGMFPAAALIFRQGLIDAADPVVIEARRAQDLWARIDPLVVSQQGYDPNRDHTRRARRAQGDISPYAFLTGPVQVAFDQETPTQISPKLERLIDERNQTVASATGQLRWDWGQRVVTLDAPRAQGVIGDLTAQDRFETQDMVIESEAPYATLVALPLDREPLARSRKILIQIGTIARPTGWRSKPVQTEDGPAEEVVAFGGPPWQINRFRGRLTLRNPGLTEAIVLDPNGMARGQIPVTRQDGALSLSLPEDALYVILR